jgi:hypothetical protein
MAHINITENMGIADVIRWANDSSNGVLSAGILALIFIVLLYKNRDEGITASLGSALFITNLAALLMWLGKFIPIEWMIMCFVSLILYAGMLKITK